MIDFTFDTDAVIRALGIERSDPEFKQNVILKLKETLDARVGERIQSMMTDEDLAAFSEVADRSDEAAKAWLAHRFPNQAELYQEEFSQLIQELKRTLDAL